MSEVTLAGAQAALAVLSTAKADMQARHDAATAALTAAQRGEAQAVDNSIAFVNDLISSFSPPANTSADPAPAPSADPSSQPAPTAS